MIIRGHGCQRQIIIGAGQRLQCDKTLATADWPELQTPGIADAMTVADTSDSQPLFVCWRYGTMSRNER
jgi:hypothetical protein